MNIIQYDLKQFQPEQVQEMYSKLMPYFDNKLVMIPKDLTILLDCDLYTLNLFKEKIEEAIREKENES